LPTSKFGYVVTNYGKAEDDPALLQVVFQFKKETLGKMDRFAWFLRNMRQLLTITRGSFKVEGSKANRFTVAFEASGKRQDINRLAAQLEDIRDVAKISSVTLPKGGQLNLEQLASMIEHRGNLPPDRTEKTQLPLPGSGTETQTAQPSEPTNENATVTVAPTQAVIRYWELESERAGEMYLVQITFEAAQPDTVRLVRASLGTTLEGMDVAQGSGRLVILGHKLPFERVLARIEAALRENGIALIGARTFDDMDDVAIAYQAAFPQAWQKGEEADRREEQRRSMAGMAYLFNLADERDVRRAADTIIRLIFGPEPED
jgi:hypothetical protein